MTTAMASQLVNPIPLAASRGLEGSTSVARVVSRLRAAAAVTKRKAEHGGYRMPRLVAVSKKHPVEKIVWAYRQGVRHFGESYVQELYSKATHIQKFGGCPDIRWHFVGHLQRNKSKLLINVPGLWMVETVDNVKAARTLNRRWSLRESGEDRLRVLVQVNVSTEHSKHGVSREACLELAEYIKSECDHLSFAGLMTIGRIEQQPNSLQPNPDFVSLRECAANVQSALQLTDGLELSMGMSRDYEHAVELGSTSVRIGTAIFGQRPD